MNTVAVTTAWEYNQLFQSLNEDPSLSLDYKKEQFARRRGHCAVKALCIAAGKHGVPYEFHKIECNGQRKILLKIGRVALIQEPILSLTEAPRASEYKRELAASHGLICQLELDLGDQPHRIRDWSGTVLAVLLHGASGPKFSQDDRALGGLMLGVPDSAYSHWVVRLDLHQLAMFGMPAEPEWTASEADEPVQRDNVNVTLKKRHRATRRSGE